VNNVHYIIAKCILKKKKSKTVFLTQIGNPVINYFDHFINNEKIRH